jgi:hypothetical protein
MQFIVTMIAACRRLGFRLGLTGINGTNGRENGRYSLIPKINPSEEKLIASPIRKLQEATTAYATQSQPPHVNNLTEYQQTTTAGHIVQKE